MDSIVSNIKMTDLEQKEKDKDVIINEKISKEIEDIPQIDVDVKNIDDKDLFNEMKDDESGKDKKKQDKTPRNLQKEFDNMVKIYYNNSPYSFHQMNDELEVRFGTRGIKPLTKIDYDNVIKKLKSLGFYSKEEAGIYRLSIQNEYMHSSGKFRLSDIRTEIYGFDQIQNYCKHNDIYKIMKESGNSVKFVQKKLAMNELKEVIYPVNFDDFNFRVSYQKEDSYPKARNFIVQNWTKNKKAFRYINRVSFVHDDYPVVVDISISKSTEKYKTYYTTDEAGIFTRPEVYEIELEVNNNAVGPDTPFRNGEAIVAALRKVITFVLGGLQGTNYPVSYPEQKAVLRSYMQLVLKDNYKDDMYVQSRHFIGPSSVTLQLKNIVPSNENSNAINIRKNYVVTEKADGSRHMLYVSNEGKIYLISSNMNVIFTGAKTMKTELFESLLDGELVLHNNTPSHDFINLYAAFDIYYLKNIDVRARPFISSSIDKEREKSQSRYMLLKSFISQLKPMSILTPKETASSKVESLTKSVISTPHLISPMRFECKKFYPEVVENGNIFDACNDILSTPYEYEIDGLIFTPAYFGVGGDKIGEAGPTKRITWEHSFKWKPPKYNTIDFLVTTLKNIDGQDVAKPIFIEGTNTSSEVQLKKYKIIQLRCSFNETKHGYLNPCQNVIDDIIPEYNPDDKDKFKPKPVQFYPTQPADPNAGITNILLKPDRNGVDQMYTREGQIFDDNMIVEFSYNLNEEQGWKWTPLRVRYDKTAELHKDKTQFGNDYNTANSNWQSIHNPITDEMIRTGLNIPSVNVEEDVYYNKTEGKFKTESLKHFHNLYVKMRLIKGASKPGNTLIDYACGKAGDLSKWINARLSFVFGIDISKDNLEHRLDGACARYINARKESKNMPYALFVNGNSAYNIKNGSAMLNDKAIQITQAVFGHGNKDPEKIGKGVAKQFGKGENGFNVSSCQFAFHYFLKNIETLQGFLRNISECTKLEGYFIGTAFDGKTIFELLKKVEPGDSFKIMEDGKKIFEIVKDYNYTVFDDNSSSVGYKIDVFQESINQMIPEYLINFDYINRVIENYGFRLITKEEANEMGLPDSTGLFSELYSNMMQEIKNNKYNKNNYGNATNMSANEKKISFMNRYFVYKKFAHVNTQNVELELTEYTNEDMEENAKQTKRAVKVAKKIVMEDKPKVIKLNKKLVLSPPKEEEKREENVVVEEEVITIKPKKVAPKRSLKQKPNLIIVDE